MVAEQMAAAFPLKRTQANGVSADLRPLQPADLAQLARILGGDRDMTWTRKEWDESNVRYLLGLRLKHYEEHGFGVYGMEDRLAGQLIGMAGAQFFDDDTPDIEVIAYVDRQQWNRGLATRVLKQTAKQIFDTCDAVDQIVAATRHDNAAAQAVARSLGMEPTGEGMHYEAPSIYWAVKREKLPR